MSLTSHSGRPSTAQRKRLLELVRANYAQITGRLTAAGNAKRRRKWIEIAHELNTVLDTHGTVRVVKSPDQWKRCWTDIRLKTKSKLDKTDIQLTSDDEAVIDICGPIAEDGDQSEEEGAKIELSKQRAGTLVHPQHENLASLYIPSTSYSSPVINSKPSQFQPSSPQVSEPISNYMPYTNYMSTVANHISMSPFKCEAVQGSPDPSRTESPTFFPNSSALNESVELQREMVVNSRTIIDMLGKLVEKAENISEAKCNASAIQSTRTNENSLVEPQSKRMKKFDLFRMCQDVLSKNNHEMNEFDCTGQNVAKKLQRMEPIQALYAESIINMALKRGLLKSLTDNTELCEGNAISK